MPNALAQFKQWLTEKKQPAAAHHGHPVLRTLGAEALGAGVGAAGLGLFGAGVGKGVGRVVAQGLERMEPVSMDTVSRTVMPNVRRIGETLGANTGGLVGAGVGGVAGGIQGGLLGAATAHKEKKAKLSHLEKFAVVQRRSTPWR